MVHGFEGHAAGDAAVADDGDHVVVLAAQLVGDGHAQGGADGGAGVAYAEGVVFAFRAVGEGADAALGADGGHPVLAASQDLVGVGLVSDVPDQLVVGGVEDIMQGDGQLDRAQARRKVPAGDADGLGQVVAQFFGEDF